MKHISKGGLFPFGVGIIVTLFVLLMIGLIVIYTGGYNVAASQGHTAFVRWAFTSTMKHAVEDRASKITIPAFTETMVNSGAGKYKVMCQHCHAGPGVERAEWAEGILPQPPHLTEAVTEWEPNEVFWLVKSGLKMTAMPAFGPTHDDETLWDIVAFVQRLPAMTAEEYAAYESTSSEQHTH